MNVSCIKPYEERLPGQRADRLGAMVVTDEGDKEFEVNYVVNSRLKYGKLEFLVHWKGYQDEDCTWEPESNLKRSRDVINDFYLTKPNAPQKMQILRADFESLFKPYENLCNLGPCWSRLEVEP